MAKHYSRIILRLIQLGTFIFLFYKSSVIPIEFISISKSPLPLSGTHKKSSGSRMRKKLLSLNAENFDKLNSLAKLCMLQSRLMRECTFFQAKKIIHNSKIKTNFINTFFYIFKAQFSVCWNVKYYSIPIRRH